jgi:hypothetical protein
MMKRFVVEQEGIVQRDAPYACTSEQTKQQPPSPQAQTTTISIKKLKALYGSYVESVLEEYLDELPKEERKMRTYRILKPLPSNGEYKELQRQTFTSTVADLVDCAFTCLEELATEMGDWYDNLPESLQYGDKAGALEEARITLESLCQPNVNERIGAMQVYYLPLYGTSSRGSRRDDAVGCLQAVVDALVTVENKENDEIAGLIDELENTISEAESVEFPGMY